MGGRAASSRTLALLCHLAARVCASPWRGEARTGGAGGDDWRRKSTPLRTSPETTKVALARAFFAFLFLLAASPARAGEPTNSWDFTRRGGVLTLAGGAGVGDQTMLQGFWNAGAGYSFTVLEVEANLGTGDAGHGSHVSGFVHFGAQARLYPLGRMVAYGVRVTPYGVAGANGGWEVIEEDDNNDGVEDSESVGFLTLGAGAEIGLADQDHDWVIFFEPLALWVNGGGNDMPTAYRGTVEGFAIRAGIRLRDFSPSTTNKILNPPPPENRRSVRPADPF